MIATMNSRKRFGVSPGTPVSAAVLAPCGLGAIASA